jgi:hypothetical protein
MAMGKHKRCARQAAMWVATQELPRSAAHPFYTRLNQILDRHDFDTYVEGLCQRFYAEEIGRPGRPPGRYFRLLLIGYSKAWMRSAPLQGGYCEDVNVVAKAPLVGTIFWWSSATPQRRDAPDESLGLQRRFRRDGRKRDTPPSGSGDLVVDVLTAVGGLADGLLMGLGDDRRGIVWDMDPVNQCSDAYGFGSDLSILAGGLRMAYAGSAKAVSAIARSNVKNGGNLFAEAVTSSQDRDTLKGMFRLGTFPNSGMPDPEVTVLVKGAAGAMESAGTTNKLANGLGVAAIVGGMLGQGGCSGR